jgi:CRISPR-associated endonuclease/helicase Cas3
MDGLKFFNGAFGLLHEGKTPFPWQKRLYEQFIQGKIPISCNIPTSLGKTAVIGVWLIAFARLVLEKKPLALPRRLIYIVNRRTVVDQSTESVERYRDVLLKNDYSSDKQQIVDQLRNALLSCSIIPDAKNPLAISTLRGELADNKQWKQEITKPAIIIGTIEMVGSKLFFLGHGDSIKMRPLHAALVGQDALIIHDEAHLDPAFTHALRKVEHIQKNDGSPYPIRVMSLSATLRAQDENCFGLNDDDRNDPVIKQRLYGKKELRMYKVKRNVFVSSLFSKAKSFKNSGLRVLVYVDTVKSAYAGYAQLAKVVKEENIRLLVGPLRGNERDHLVKHPVYEEFKKEIRDPSKTVYMIATSAGEVGANINADIIICDLVTLERMIQRLGRGNRFGMGTASIYMFWTEESVSKVDKQDKSKTPKTVLRLRTLNALQKLPNKKINSEVVYDASVEEISKLSKHNEAYTIPPEFANIDEGVLDACTLTTLKVKEIGRGEVSDLLKGYDPNAEPHTYVVWRSCVPMLCGVTDEKVREEFFEKFPLKQKEILHDVSRRVSEELLLIGSRNPYSPVLVLDQDGLVSSFKFQTLLRNLSRDETLLENKTIILPVEVGGLSPLGILRGISTEPVSEVSDESRFPGDTFRCVAEKDKDVWSISEGQQKGFAGERGETLSEFVRKIASNVKASHAWTGVLENTEEGDKKVIMYFSKYKKNQRAYKSQLLQEHHADVLACLKAILDKLSMDNVSRQALLYAAENHDEGKAREIWQEAAGNNGGPLLAKTNGMLNPHALHQYRHEFGTYMKLRDNSENLNGAKDLCLHVICTHHGRSRPNFEKPFDPNYRDDDCQKAADEAILRFSALQNKHGRWGLAWYETLLRVADGLASSGQFGDSE